MESIRICDISHTVSGQNRYSILLVDNLKAFKSSEHLIDIAKFQQTKIHFIILLNGSSSDIHQIFSYFWTRTIFNLMGLINRRVTLLLSIEPFSNSRKCGNTKPKIINKFVNGTFKKVLDFNIRFKDLHLCPIKLTTFVYGAAVFKEVQHNESFTLVGYEIEMIKTISKMLNFTLDLDFRDGIQQWGVIYDNGTCTRAMGRLKNQKTEIVMGNIFLRASRMKYFDSSISYMVYPVFFVLSPEHKVITFEKFLNPFQTTVWIFIVLTFMLGVVIILIIDVKFKEIRAFVFGEKVNHPMRNMFLAIIGQSQSVLPKNNFARFILMMFLILCLIIRSCYQGSLYKYLQMDERYKEPQTIQELIDKNFTFIMSESNVDIMKKYRPKISIVTKPTEGDEDLDLDFFADTEKKTATFASRVDLLKYSLDHDTFPYKICKESFFTINVVLLYNKNFFLKASIDDAIQRLLTHGFIEHWINEHDKTDRWKFEDSHPIVMTYEHLSGAFNLLFVGCLAATLAFLVEHLIQE
ncbi:glutamate receptor ionotropic, NMDA 1-like [Chironomus tepperi]|uniref:glutamate receptor ionotropic, NMDA 1-like n=1 Tax=Chironomus tepperi TaxID=113505 RepID=UPI00391F14E4